MGLIIRYMYPEVVCSQNHFTTHTCVPLSWCQKQDNMKYEQYYISLKTYVFLLSPLLENIWVWSWMGSGIWTWISSWLGAGSTFSISTLRFNHCVAGLIIFRLLCHMGSIFGWSFTFHTGWLGGFLRRRIFGCFINGNTTWIPTWISKSLRCDWLFVWISGWNYYWHVSCKYSWIPDWVYFIYQLVWSLSWHM